MRFVDVALAAEAALIIGVVATIPYTEMDWMTYMEKVRGFLEGEVDYKRLKGGTEPLAYPGGFVWLFSVLYGITKQGLDIFLAQWIYAGVYLATWAMVLRLYTLAGLPWKTMIPLFFSKRIRSIYVLQLFTDCWVMLFVFAAVTFIAGYPHDRMSHSRRWLLGCLCFSTAVSIQMSALLFAPGLFYVMLRHLPLWKVAWYLLISVAWQVAAGLPFLLHDYKAYVSRGFDLGRVLTQRWSVNYQFLDRKIYTMPEFSFVLLVLMVAAWLLLWRRRWAPRRYMTAVEAQTLHPCIADTCPPGVPSHASEKRVKTTETEKRAIYAATVLTVFEANLVGVVFARSLHYQFYAWFFFTIPFALHFTAYPRVMQLVTFGLIRAGFESYPPTPSTSALLQAGFALLLVAVVFFGREAATTSLPDIGKAKTKKLAKTVARHQENSRSLAGEPGRQGGAASPLIAAAETKGSGMRSGQGRGAVRSAAAISTKKKPT